MSVSFIYDHHLVGVKWLKDWLNVDFLVQSTINPANICWPSRLLKTSSRHVLKTFPTCLQHKIFLSFKTSCKDILKTSSRRLGRQKIVTLKTSSSRLGDQQNIYWGYLYLANLNLYLTNLDLRNLYLTNLWRIQNALIRTQ